VELPVNQREKYKHILPYLAFERIVSNKIDDKNYYKNVEMEHFINPSFNNKITV
jgi:hypothetical protein